MAQQHKQSKDANGLLRHRAIGDVSFLERNGDGPTLVFLHGIGSSSDSFLSLFQGFPEGPRLIAWNAPGYLKSKPLAADRPTPMDYAVVLERFFDDLGLNEATIIGHSLGTLIAAAFALRAPTRVSSIVFAAPAQGYGIDADQPMPSKAADRLKDLEFMGPEAFAAERASRLVFAPERNPAVVDRVRHEMARINPDGYAQAVHMLASGDLSGSVAQLQLKPSFIVGAEDRITPIDQTQAAMLAWSEVHGETPRCISIPEAGHAVYVQAPQAFRTALHELVPAIQTPTPSHAEGELYGG